MAHQKSDSTTDLTAPGTAQARHPVLKCFGTE